MPDEGRKLPPPPPPPSGGPHWEVVCHTCDFRRETPDAEEASLLGMRHTVATGHITTGTYVGDDDAA